MTVSDALREAIRQSGLSLNEIEKRSGVDHGALSRFLNANRTLTLPAVDKLAETLGLELVQDDAVWDERREATRERFRQAMLSALAGGPRSEFDLTDLAAKSVGSHGHWGEGEHAWIELERLTRDGRVTKRRRKEGSGFSTYYRLAESVDTGAESVDTGET